MPRDQRTLTDRLARIVPVARPVMLVAIGLAALSGGQPRAAERIAAHIGTGTIDCQTLRARGPRACAAALLYEIGSRVERHLVDRYGLHATEDEIGALRAYRSAFLRHDREQRARKLDELEARLARMAADADPAERERLLEFRVILKRLAAYEADVDRGLEVRPEPSRETLVAWIEEAKLDAALYRHYGGTVGVKPTGPYAHAGRAAALAEYMLRERMLLPDPEVARHFVGALWSPPAIAYAGEAPDFTPFWMRPLVPSYVGP